MLKNDTAFGQKKKGQFFFKKQQHDSKEHLFQSGNEFLQLPNIKRIFKGPTPPQILVQK